MLSLLCRLLIFESYDTAIFALNIENNFQILVENHVLSARLMCHVFNSGRGPNQEEEGVQKVHLQGCRSGPALGHAHVSYYY
jgi:hypothetical protein